MKKGQIRQKLLNYLELYRKNIGTFNSMVIIMEFVDFIISEPYTKALVKPFIDEFTDQLKIAEPQFDQFTDRFKQGNLTLDREFLTNQPLFKDRTNYALKCLDEGNLTAMKLEDSLPIYLGNLFLIYTLLEDLRNKKKLKKNEQLTDDQIKIACDLPTLALTVKLIPDKNLIFSISQTYYAYLNGSCTYLLNKIDAEHFLAKGKSNQSLRFDQNSSTLYIKGKSVDIKRRSDTPVDHHILVALFGQENLADPIEFHQIAKDTMKIVDYDSKKGWSKFRSACDKLNQKVDKVTNHEIPDFIEYTTGRTGWCKINAKYL